MDVSPAQLLDRAKERFALHDHFGAIHILEELIASGRAFADAYHLLGVSYHLVGQSERALAARDVLALSSDERCDTIPDDLVAFFPVGRWSGTSFPANMEVTAFEGALSCVPPAATPWRPYWYGSYIQQEQVAAWQGPERALADMASISAASPAHVPQLLSFFFRYFFIFLANVEALSLQSFPSLIDLKTFFTISVVVATPSSSIALPTALPMISPRSRPS